MNNEQNIKSHIINRLYDDDIDIKVTDGQGKAVVDGYLVSFVWDERVGFVESTITVEKYVGSGFTDY